MTEAWTPKSDPNNKYESHYKYDEYSDFLDASLKPECQHCAYMLNFICEQARRVIKAAAVLSEDGTDIERIDHGVEETELLASQRIIQDINRPCGGHVIVENDIEDEKSMIDFLARHNYMSPETAAERRRNILSITEDCGLLVE